MRGLAQRVRKLESGNGKSGIAIAAAHGETVEETWAAVFGPDVPMPDDPTFLIVRCNIFQDAEDMTREQRMQGTAWGPRGQHYQKLRTACLSVSSGNE